MRTITTETQAYTIHELSDKAKERAHYQWLENFEFFGAEYVIEDATQVAALMGWEIDKVFYSGFWSQGDGACFEGTMRYAKGCYKNVCQYAPKDKELHRIAKEWQDIQKRAFYALSAKVKQAGHYMHSGCTSFDCTDTRTQWGYVENAELEETIIKIGRDFMDWIYKQLENAYDYDTSLEAFIESCEANSYEFDEFGKML